MRAKIKTYDEKLSLALSSNVDIKRKQESPAIADKPAQRKSMPKIAPIIRRVYNVIADDTGLSSFV